MDRKIVFVKPEVYVLYRGILKSVKGTCVSIVLVVHKMICELPKRE